MPRPARLPNPDGSWDEADRPPRSGRLLVVVALLGAAALGLLVYREFDGPDTAGGSDAGRVADECAKATTDLTRYGIRAVIDVPINAKIEPTPFGANVRFRDGTDLAVETTGQAFADEKAEALADAGAKLVVEDSDRYLVRSGPDFRPVFRFRKDIKTGDKTVRAAGVRTVSRAADAETDPVWAAAQSLRQTDEQEAAEPARTTAVAKLATAGIKPTTDPGGGVALAFMGRPPLTDTTLALLGSVTDLASLEIDDGEKLSPVAFDVVRGLRHLRKLTLRGPWVTDAVISRFAGHPGLEELKLTETTVGDAGLAALAGMTNLRTLWVVRGGSVAGPGLEHLAGLTKLRHLRISHQRLTDAGLARLPALPELRTLDLSSTAVGDAGLRGLRPFENLESLDLSRTRVTGAGLAGLAASNHLESLNLAFSDADDAGLSACRGLPIKVLNLTATRVGDTGAGHVATMAKLVTLDLSCTRVTDTGVESLSALADLSTLNLRHTDVEGRGLAALVRCPALISLDLTGSPCGNAGLANALTLPALTQLGMSDTRITDEGLKHFRRFPSDRVLNFACDRNNVTRAAVAALAQTRPNVTGSEVAARADPSPAGTTAPPIPAVSLATPDFAAMLRRVGGTATYSPESPEKPVAVALLGDKVTDADLADLRDQTTLKTLTIRSDRVTDAGLASLAALKSLEELHLTGRKIVGDGFSYVAELRSLRRLGLPWQPLPARALALLSPLKNLESLEIPDDQTASGPAAIALYAGLPKLQRLDLKRIGNNDLLRLRGLTAMTDLRFRTRTERIDRWALEGLERMEELKRLTIEGGADDRGLAAIAAVGGLESLEVTKGEFVTDAGLTPLANLTRLRRLVIPGSRVTDRGLGKLSDLDRLAELDVSGSRVTDRGLAALPRKNLRALNLANTDVSDDAVADLGAMKGLKRVTLTGTRVTPAGLASLRKLLPDLEIEYAPERPT